MIRSFRTISAACLALVILSGGVRADGDAPPYDMVRVLQKLQDRIATGDIAAQAAYAKGMQHAARTFASVKLATWSDKRNARALIAYLFSGGNAAAIDAAVPHNAIASESETLYKGALAYGLGQDDAARANLLTIDAKTLPTGLGGHLALVQGTLVSNTDRTRAIAFLDMARLLEPGTLVEEAALRKEMLLIGPSGDLDKFALLARRYLGGFGHSIYIGNFRQLFTRTAMQVGAEDRADAAGRLTKLLDGLGKDERRRIYLAVAREAVLDGRIGLAATVSEEAGRLAPHGEADEARAMVYFGAATIVGDRYEVGMKALNTAAADRLDAGDKVLRASALAVGDMIRAPVVLGAGGVGEADQQAILADAARSLGEADALVADGQK